MPEKRRDIFISNKPEPDADDSDFWTWLDKEDAEEYARLRKEGKLIEIKDNE